jgi:superfamily II DNA/RNA helicase
MLRRNVYLHRKYTCLDPDKVIAEFRDGVTKVLIATDVLARGIDVPAVTLVINYELPSSIENYLHRIGRSGRFGRKGVAINLVSPRDKPVMKEIEEFYKTVVAPLPVDFANILH